MQTGPARSAKPVIMLKLTAHHPRRQAGFQKTPGKSNSGGNTVIQLLMLPCGDRTDLMFQRESTGCRQALPAPDRDVPEGFGTAPGATPSVPAQRCSGRSAARTTIHRLRQNPPSAHYFHGVCPSGARRARSCVKSLSSSWVISQRLPVKPAAAEGSSFHPGYPLPCESVRSGGHRTGQPDAVFLSAATQRQGSAGRHSLHSCPVPVPGHPVQRWR